MSERPTGRRPGAYDLPSSQPAQQKISAPRAPRAVADMTRVEIEADDTLEREALEALDAEPARRQPSRRRLSFGKLATIALSSLASLALALSVDRLISELFARADWLGWLAIGLTILLLVGVGGIVLREVLGLMRLDTVERERRDGRRAFEANDAAAATAVVARLRTLLADRSETARGRARLAELRDDVIDGRDLVALAERELLLPLDARARALVAASSKRVSVVTAVSPRAIVDLAFVLFETVRLIRAMSELYGARPGAIGLARLTSDVLAHLAVTGTISVGDSLIGQVVGHGVAARLSARLGEGVVNGLLTARIGLAAMDLCRPLPFLTIQRPKAGDFLGDLARGDANTDATG
ncbi:YcjF family protein [Aureimonas jatrophae]|uniref:Putative membrane protein n=1 Tax=Aureimonas jatrophae TaxID=1166073 RepID=A0A1H0GJ66_9HYPH|nr:TIGR01620 family protein [Aureimonas jatrophae]MBB3949590.1 putative membrane protein [Aureimonas jatrophae]SDO06771.1 putative membrane protein [Aureimonas jatrophae]